MIQDLRVVLVQSLLIWEDAHQSLDHLSKHLAKLSTGGMDVVVLPEMFTTGFSMNAERIAEPFSASMHSLEWMKDWAKKLDAVLTGSIAVREGDAFFNRMFWVRPDGTWSKYDKRHLFRMAGEHKQYSAGEEFVVEEWRGWKCSLQVCYDLRFPVWMRNKQDSAGEPTYDILFFVANWPAVRSSIWTTLLKARAIENQCYVVGVNRVGEDGNGLLYSGDSASLDAKGEDIVRCSSGSEEVSTAVLSFDALRAFRQQFPVLDDGDAFELLP
jgi:omega-amidase